MSFFSKIVDFVSGGIGEKIIGTVTKYFPPKLSEAERGQLEEAIRQAAREHEITLIRLAQEEQEEFNARLKDLEGTAKDLAQFGILGKVIVFLRGAQRPIWGIFVLYMDYMVFSGKWVISTESTTAGLDMQSAFWMINLLVLGFLFGERAMRNVMPYFRQRFPGRQAEG